MSTQKSVVEKSYAYITRNEEELLVFRGPGHDGLQIPKGTVEPGEDARDAAIRETIEETGLATFGEFEHLTTDVWTRRNQPPEQCVRHFFHANVYEPRDEWTHVVSEPGEESGTEFEFSWVPVPPVAEFALDTDEYVSLVDCGDP